MNEDKLDQPQRIRLEALAQSIIYGMNVRGAEKNREVIQRARTYEQWIAKGIEPGEVEH